MSIWGKIVGGAVGFALGGPIGALVGGIAGHFVDVGREAQTLPPPDDDALRAGDPSGRTINSIAFTIAVIALGAKMAKADGRVTRDEVEAFKQVFHVPEGEMRNVARVFDRAKHDATGFEPYAEQVARMFADRPALLEDLLDGLFHIAKADGRVNEPELVYLERVARIFGFDAAAFARIREAHIGPDQADPYVILGIDRTADDASARRRYRELVRQHHPDTLIAQGLPEEFVRVANERLASINAAWDRIAKERGLN